MKIHSFLKSVLSNFSSAKENSQLLESHSFLSYVGVYSKLVFGFVFMLGLSGTLFSQGCLNPDDLHNSPCTSCLYDFGGGAGNIVPCGPSANTTSSVPINHENGNTVAPLEVCGGLLDSPNDDVLWVSFLINTGGSFEWQTVAGADKFYWEMYYSSTQPPDDGSSNDPNTTDCNNLVFYKCGTQFTGWEVEATPDPTKQWRYYIAYYFQSTDKDKEGDGVVKIRKSCGLACADNDIAVVASDDVCILGSPGTVLTATASGGGGSYSYSWLPIDGLDDPNSATPTATPGTTTTYTVTVVGVDGCPAADEVAVNVGGCCDADAGTISLFGQLTSCDSSLDSYSFIASPGANAPSPGYALILVDMEGNIQLFDDSPDNTNEYNFLFSSLDKGMYFVYALSYDGDISTYLTAKIGNPVSGIQTEIDGGLCADLIYGGNNNKITVLRCGTFPQN